MMKVISEEVFRERLLAIHKARSIFIESGLTKNITEAFKIYLEILSEEKHLIAINNPMLGKKYSSFFSRLRRPACPECGKQDMRIKFYNDDNGRRSALFCPHVGCEYGYYTPYKLDEWAEIFRAHQDKPLDFTQFERVLRSELELTKKKTLITHGLKEPCPSCGGIFLYAAGPCCGAKDGIIECEQCNFSQPLTKKLPGSKGPRGK